MKTIIKKSTGEYAVYLSGDMWTSEIPTLLAPTATMDAIKFIHKNSYKDQKKYSIKWSDYEIINVKVIREFSDLKTVKKKK